MAAPGGTGPPAGGSCNRGRSTLVGLALYHAQQGAEKALKGFLVSKGVPYLLTHDLRKLLQLCGENDPELVELLMPAAGLTQFSVRFRYPGEEQPTCEEALPWLNLARSVLYKVQQRISDDSAPSSPNP